MKDLLLGLSLAGNLVLGYTLLKKTNAFDELDDKINSLSDQVEGKAKQVKGAVTGNASDKIDGNLQSAKGNVENKVSDIKDKLSD